MASAHWVPLRLLADQAAVISSASVNGGAAPVPVPASVLRRSTAAGTTEDEEVWEEHPYRLSIDIASRLVSSPHLQPIARWLLGGAMHFYYAPLPNRPVVSVATDAQAHSDALHDPSEHGHRPPRRRRHAHNPPLQLWGITLGITLDFLDRLFPAPENTRGHVLLPELQQPPEACTAGIRPGRTAGQPARERRLPPLVPVPRAGWSSSWWVVRVAGAVRLRILARTAVPTAAFNARAMRSIVPSFPAPDINFYILLASGRYRRVLAAAAAARERATDGGTNWVAISVHAYYLALRRALLLALVTRSLGVLCVLALLVRLGRRALAFYRRIRAHSG